MQRVATVIVVAAVISVAQGSPQLSTIFRPAINFINTLSGNSNDYLNSEPNKGQSQYFETHSEPNKGQQQYYETHETHYAPSTNYQTQQYESPSNYQIQHNYQTQPQASYQSSGGSCDGIFSYRSDYGGNYGLLSINNPDYSRNNLRVEMTLAARLSSNYYGEIDLAKSKQSSANDVASGQPLTYKVKFPLQNPLPKLTAVYLNNQLICSGVKDSQFVTTLKLVHTFTTGLTGGLAHRPTYTEAPVVYQTNPPVVYQTNPPVYETAAPVRYTTRRTTARPVYTQATTQATTQQVIDRVENFECGIPDYDTQTTTGLIVGGQDANRGQFPWLAAYYFNGRGTNGFICGGSLVSTKIVVTAAHCVQDKKEATKRKAEASTFYLGKYNLDSLNSEQGFIMSGVSQLEVHPEWNYNDERFDADIAVAILIREISFNKFIKPICLWTSTTSYEDLVGTKAIIAGWGKTEFNAVSTEKPKWAAIPVVDTLTCIRSNFALNDLTSDRTFCAGNPKSGGDKSPCSGDSGGGLIVKNGKKWYLRGIISSSLFNATISMCDTANYAVFTDMAKFVGWVQGFIQTYG